MMDPVRIVQVGGGSYTWKMLATDYCLNPELHGEIVLYDIDPDAVQTAKLYYERCNQAIGNKWEIEAANNLAEALQGANVVVVTINHGGFPGTRIDLEVPARFGITQTVGDTVGPGGISRAIRNVPAIVNVAELVQKYCPSAYILNCSNPMTMMNMAAARVHPNTIGYCHEWWGFQSFLREKLGIPDEAKWRPVIIGQNHFAPVVGLLEISNGDQRSVFDDVRQRFLALNLDFLPGVDFLPDYVYERMSPFQNQRILAHALVRRLGVLLFAGDRHLVEFLPTKRWLDLKTLRELAIKVTTYDFRFEKAQEAKAQFERQARGEEPIPQKHSSEEVDLIIAAMFGGKPYATNVVIPGEVLDAHWQNHGYSGVPFDPRVYWEASCQIQHLNNQPIIQPVLGLPKAVADNCTSEYLDLANRHAYVCRQAVEGICTSNWGMIADALWLDPLTQSRIGSYNQCRKLANRFFAEQL